jgi:hypothetical protein
MDRRREDKMTETLTSINDQVAQYVEALNDSSSEHHKFSILKGRKYLKVIDQRPTATGPLDGHSVHAFIEISTGYVYKPAGHSKPAPIVRFQLMDIGSYARLLHAASQPEAFAGGYLYVR